jgi:hypothetical protein
MCQAALRIGIVPRSIDLSDDEGDIMEGPQTLASEHAGAMDGLAHEQAEARAKSTQEPIVVGAKLPQEQAPLEKTPTPKPQMTQARKKTGDAMQGP